MIQAQQLTAAWLSRVTDPGAWHRGSRYFASGRARVEQVERLPDGGVRLTGSCQGSAAVPYQQSIDIVPRGRRPALTSQCSCPVGSNCKHVVALVLTWQATSSRVVASRDQIDDWLADAPFAKPAGPESSEALLYVFKPAGGVDSGTAEVEYRVARKRKDGHWGKGQKASRSAFSTFGYGARKRQPIDEEILKLLRAGGTSFYQPELILSGAAGHMAFMRMIESGRAFWTSERADALQPGPARMLQVRWTEENGLYRLSLSVDGNAWIVPVEPPCYIDADSLTAGAVELPAGLDMRLLSWLREAPPIPAARAQALSHRLKLAMPAIPTPVNPNYHDIDGPPVPVLRILFEPETPQASRADLHFDYGPLEVESHRSGQEIIAEADQRLVRVRRDRDAERAAIEQLVETGITAMDSRAGAFYPNIRNSAQEPRQAWLRWLDEGVPDLKNRGWRIEYTGGAGFRLSSSAGIEGEVAPEGNDWFSLRFDLEFDGRSMPLLPLVSQLLKHYRPGELPDKLYLDSGDNHYVSVSAEQIEPVLQTIFDLFDRIKGDALELARPDASRLLDLESIPVRGATNLHKLALKLADFSGLKTVKPPPGFKGSLRAYQQHGLNWLQFLREHELAGILADDMGLGKTIQTLAHLAVEKRTGRMQHPSLLVAPTSLMGNWRREAELFTPGLKVLVLHGPSRDADFERLAEFDLVLTTYPLLPRDRAVLLEQPWHYLILDEAQQIKNPLAQAAQVVRKLHCRHRLCLTGTPMENHLGELWAQFDFLMPGFLGDRENFNRNYRTPIEKHGDAQRLERLNRRIAPFLLRRTKDLVAAELPPKTELLRRAQFEGKQARLYESIRLTMEQKVRNAIAAKGLARSHIVVLDALLKLRQVCCDPRLLPQGTPGAGGAPSAKFNLLFDLLPQLLEEGRRVLLFSQFTTMLGLIADELDSRGIAYAKLTGQTRKREEAIARFRDGEVGLFLISLKAGGVGLNLVEADTVIHYDPWWNPAVEQQATDRAHRIGQDKPVFIYKLVAEGTVEEKILALQERKQKLVQGVYGKGGKPDQPPIDEETIQALLAGD